MVCWLTVLPADVLKSRVQIGKKYNLGRDYKPFIVIIMPLSVLAGFLIRACILSSVLSF